MEATNIEYLVADTQDLPIPDNSFDCVICQFGFMFLQDKQKGFNEAWRVLKPGGQFIFVTWDKEENNITLYLSKQTVKSYLSYDPPPLYARPYAMHDLEVPREYVLKAGFNEANIENIILHGTCPTAMDAAIGFVEGNAIIHEILGVGTDLLETIKTEIVKKINSEVCPDPVISKISAWYGEAFK